MKKTRFLAMILVISLMMMGASYAAWTDQIVISNTVSTGELDVELLPGGSVSVNDSLNNRTAEYVVNADTEQDNDLAEVTITNLYPGAEATVTIPVRNIGTIPLKLDTVIENYDETNMDYTLTLISAPTDLAVDQSGNITYKVTVNDDAPELDTIQFTVTVDYKQFNM